MAEIASEQNLIESTPRGALGEMLSLALPTIAQMASYTLMQFFDTWMLARAGHDVDAPTAGSNAGMLAFSVISLGMGTLWVVNTLVSQSFGRKNFVSCGRYLWQGIWFAVAFSLLLLPTLPWVSLVFRGMGHEAQLVDMESAYLRIMLAGSMLKLISAAFSQFLLAVDRPHSVLIATLIGVAVNSAAAYVMIFGKLGLSPMGVRGSAWGQTIGVCFEMLAMITAAALPAFVRQTYHLRDVRFRREMFETLLRVGLPSGVQIVADVLAWSLYTMWVMGVFGTKAMAANTFIFRFMSVSFMPAFGLGTAVTALVGRSLGAGRLDLARQRADLGFALAAGYMLSCGLLFFLGRHWLMGLFTQDADVLKLGSMLLVFAAIYQFFDAMYIIYNGALRGAGDTFVPAVATGVLCWGITVFGGFLIAKFYHQWGVAGPWTAATGYGIILGVFMLVRFRQGRWKAIPHEIQTA